MAQQYSGDSPRKYGKGTDVPYERNVSVNSEVYDDKDYGRVGASGDDQRFARAECKDVFWAVLFLAHFFAVVIIGFYYYSMYHTEIGAAQDLNAATSSRPRLSVNGNFWVIVGVSLLGGLALSVLWLVVIRTWPKAVIWFSIVFVFVVLTVLTVYLFLRARYWQAALMLIVIAVMVVWVVLIQRRIKFSMVMLEVVVNFIQTFPSVIYFAVALVLVQGAWLVIWALCTIAILYAADGKVAASKKELTGFTFFAMAISFFWTTQVVKNLVHMTTVGTLATWAFYPEEQRPDQPAMRSFKRAITTSFGSICLGSLIVAIIRAIRLMIENTVENDFLRCCAVCIMDCIDGIVRYFNMYAYTKCAIYGLSYCEAAVETWKLLLSRGIVMAINDDIIGMVLFTGSIIGGLATAGMAAFIANAFESESKIIILYAVLGFLVGLAMTICAMEVVESGVAALFVCYADDPAAIEQAQPAVFAKVHRAFRETYPHGDDL